MKVLFTRLLFLLVWISVFVYNTFNVSKIHLFKHHGDYSIIYNQTTEIDSGIVHSRYVLLTDYPILLLLIVTLLLIICDKTQQYKTILQKQQQRAPPAFLLL
ncbi:MAG: hypothetical protein ACRCTJ_01525 [Brevinema sp.]